MTENVKAFLYPILEEGNLSYPDGIYSHSFVPGTTPCSVVIKHQLEGCPIIEKWIVEKQAHFSCAVSVPITGYRSLHTSSDKDQEIQWKEDVLGEPPYFRPCIVVSKAIEHRFTADDGVSHEWVDKKVMLEKGSKIGFGHFYRMASSLQHLLSVILDEELADGTFYVQECTNEGFFFEVMVAEDLHRFLQSPGDSQLHRNSIYTHIVSSCFQILHQKYSSNEDLENWRSHSNLRALQKFFEQHELDLWDAEDFSPDEAATKLYPHRTENTLGIQPTQA